MSLIPAHLQARRWCHFSYYFFSLTTDLNRASQNPRVPVSALGKDDNNPGVRVHYLFTSGCLSILFHLEWQLMATLKEGDLWQMWEFIRI